MTNLELAVKLNEIKESKFLECILVDWDRYSENLRGVELVAWKRTRKTLRVRYALGLSRRFRKHLYFKAKGGVIYGCTESTGQFT